MVMPMDWVPCYTIPCSSLSLSENIRSKREIRRNAGGYHRILWWFEKKKKKQLRVMQKQDGMGLWVSTCENDMDQKLISFTMYQTMHVSLFPDLPCWIAQRENAPSFRSYPSRYDGPGEALGWTDVYLCCSCPLISMGLLWGCLALDATSWPHRFFLAPSREECAKRSINS